MSRPMIKPTLSATNTLAFKAHLKLRKEAMLPEHRLRFLFCHANMLDAIRLSLDEMNQHQVEQRRCKASPASPKVESNVFDLQVQSAEQITMHSRKADSFMQPSDGKEISPSTPACASEIISQIGYDLARTLSRRAGEDDASNIAVASLTDSETDYFNKSMPVRSDTQPHSHVMFENPIVIRVC